MKIFIDCEFNRLPTVAELGSYDPIARLKLVSIGLISETGEHFYAELNDSYVISDCQIFTEDVVLPLLQGGAYSKSKYDCRLELNAWLSQFDDPKIVCDYNVDFLLLNRLLSPLRTFDDFILAEFYDMGQIWAFQEAARKFFDPVSRPRHHALNDAMALRESWNAAVAAPPVDRWSID